MKKNEDTKKHSGGEKPALKTGGWIKISLFLFLILSGISYPQIPLNGFCTLKSYTIPAGYEKILAADLNNDQIDELIVYSTSLKKIGIISFIKGGTINIDEYNVAFEFSLIRKVKDLKSDSNIFVCVSRKNRTIAVYNIGLTTAPELRSKVTFDSYPENISIADINNDGKVEFLVSGIGFDGLSVLFREEGRLAEKKIISGESFSHAVFTDISNDGFTDIVAFNIISNSLDFFYNDTDNNFNLERKNNLTENISQFYTTDFDSDGFSDLIFTSGKGLKIMYGDFQSGYEKIQTLRTKHLPNSIQFGDYNKNKLYDFVYINFETENVNVLFNKDNNIFYDEITFTNLSSVSSITNFNREQNTNLAILSKDGFITAISSFNLDFKQTSIVPSNRATTIQKFDLYKDGVSDICFIDESDFSFRIIARNSEGIPVSYYSNKLAESHQIILVEDFFKVRKTFYCYSEENQLIEYLKINFKTNKVVHKQLYSPGKIKDVAVQRVDSNLVNIYLLYEKANKLFLGKFEHRDLSLTFKEYPFIDRDVICAELFVDKEIKVFYWKEKSDSLFFNEVAIKTGPNIYKGILGFSKGDSIKISLTASNQLFRGKPWLISLVKVDDEELLVSLKEKNYKKLYSLDSESNNDHLVDNILSFAMLQNDESESLLVYSPGAKSLSKLIISDERKNYSLRQLIRPVSINNFFIDKFNSTNYHLVYSDKEKGNISIVQLK